MSDRFKLLLEAHLILLDDEGRVLLLRRCNTDYENGSYSLVAGKVEAGEEVTAAAIREAREEVGVEVRPEDIEVASVMHRKADDGFVSVAFFLAARAWNGEVVNTEPQHHDVVEWRRFDDLPPKVIPYVRQALGNYRHGPRYDSYGWDRSGPVNRTLMTDRFKLIPEVQVFLMNDLDQILLLRRFNTGHEDGNYGVVAGHVEADEEVVAAAIREATEEAGIHIRPADIEVVGVMHRNAGIGRVSFFLVCRKWCGNIVNAEPDKCDDVSWHSIHDLPGNMVPCIRQGLKNYRNGTYYDGVGWDEKE